MDRRTQIKIWLKEILDKNIPVPYRAFIFGSQANKIYLSRSDIDIGVISEVITSHQLAKIMGDIDTLPMLYRVDLVNFNEVEEQFKSIALSNIEYL